MSAVKLRKDNRKREEFLNTIPVFLAKTYRIVDDPAYTEIIGWNAQGLSFAVRNLPRLTNEVFPKHFKHSNFASFVRQLNMYGFHKVRSESDGLSYSHECFLRDSIQKLVQIKRKVPAADELLQSASHGDVTFKETELEQEVEKLKQEHSTLQTYVKLLAEQNKTISLQNRNYLTMMDNMRQGYRKKIETLMLLLIFGKNSKSGDSHDFIFPHQFEHMLAAFEHQNNDKLLALIPPHKDRIDAPKMLKAPSPRSPRSSRSIQPEELSEFIDPLQISIQRSDSEDFSRMFKHGKQSEDQQSEYVVHEAPPSPLREPMRDLNREEWQKFIEELNHSQSEQEVERPVNV